MIGLFGEQSNFFVKKRGSRPSNSFVVRLDNTLIVVVPWGSNRGISGPFLNESRLTSLWIVLQTYRLLSTGREVGCVDTPVLVEERDVLFLVCFLGVVT